MSFLLFVVLQSVVYLPFVSGFYISAGGPSATVVDFRVARVDAARNASNCLDALGPVLASGQGGICLAAGDYLSLASDNPSGLAIGGRYFGGNDAAWGGDPDDYDLIAPRQIIADADIVEIVGVTGYVEQDGPFVGVGGEYSIIYRQFSDGAVAAQQLTPLQDMADFQQTLTKMLDEGQTFDVDFPGDQLFWDRGGLVSFSPGRCGVSHAVWAPEPGRVNILFDRSPAWIIVRGYFALPALDACMGNFRWVKVSDLMTVPAARDLRLRVDARRKGNITPFQWLTTAQGQVYAFWSIATGTLAYYGYRVMNAAQPSPAIWLYIPEEFLDVTCSTVAGVKTCLITEGQPEQ